MSRQSMSRGPMQADEAAGCELTLQGVRLLGLGAHGWSVTRCHRQHCLLLPEAKDGREDGPEAAAGRSFGRAGVSEAGWLLFGQTLTLK